MVMYSATLSSFFEDPVEKFNREEREKWMKKAMKYAMKIYNKQRIKNMEEGK